MRRLARILLVSAAAISAHAGAQTQLELATSAPALEVQRLAPQLVAFAGGDVNFQNLANGLALGLPVTLTSALAPGQTQVVTFTPTATMTPLAIAQSLEAVRQQLIALGVAAPNAAQLGVALVGGTLATAAGNVPLTGVVAVNGQLASSVQGQTSASAFLPGLTNTMPQRFVSDRSTFGNVSDTPARPQLVVPGTAAGTTSGTTTGTTTPSTAPFAAPGSGGAAAGGTSAPFGR
jgi:hypothetical protein